ncbi:MAG: hypothetical protein HKN43_13570 [Rhodothermales bacterium]|nr:hypothetical protein [Rhodothermales bacterium]
MGRFQIRPDYMRIGSIDIGTNTALLLVADVKDNVMHEVLEDRETVRLGEGVDSSGRITEAAIGRLASALERYAKILKEAGAERVVVTGTSASRDATNGAELERIVRKTIGVPYQILSGEIEALLTFIAATFPTDDKVTIVDIGGGSTEVVLGRRSESGPEISSATSYNLGSVRLTERLISDYPVPDHDLERIEDTLSSTLNDLERGQDPRRLIAIGGTATTTALVLRNMDPGLISQDLEIVLSPTEIGTFTDLLVRSSVDEIMALSPPLMKGRADVIGAGMLILGKIVQLLSPLEVVVRFRGIRHAAAQLAGSKTYEGSIAAEARNVFR